MEANLYGAFITRDGESHLFLSPDDAHYIEVDLPRLPPEMSEDDADRLRDQVANLIAGKSPDGEDRRTLPMTMARRFFTQLADEDKTSDVTLYQWEAGEWIVARDIKFQGARS